MKSSFNSLWALIIGLGLMLPVSIVMLFVTMAHPPLPRTVPSMRKTALPCTCGGCPRRRTP